jgi:hypothetical protein
LEIGTIFVLSEKIKMMKKLMFFALLILCAFTLEAQTGKAAVLQDLENKQPANQTVTATATLMSSSRLFKAKDDLTSVILVIPAGSKVDVLDSDSTYVHIVFEENEGYILKRHTVIDKIPDSYAQTVQDQPADVKAQPVQKQVISRLAYLESKYGSDMAAKIVAGKIWKGMNAEMVTDSWGIAQKVNKVNSGSIRNEEWLYKNTWLYFENNTLIEWGQLRK